jgi:uncharacterized membrane protein
MSPQSHPAAPAADPDARPGHRIRWGVASLLILFGAIGWIAAFALTLEKFVTLENPDAALSCDLSALVQCGTNLRSAQGEVFGFPNPILGLAGFVAPIAVGVGMLAGARFARWFHLAFQLGVTGALAFVVWLIAQSIFVLGTLCPWCMVVWSITIPLFLVTTFDNLRAGRFGGGERAERLGGALLGWTAPIAIACYLVVAIVAQVQLDVLGSL